MALSRVKFHLLIETAYGQGSPSTGCAHNVNNYENRDLVNFIAFCQRVEYGVHGVQHRHHFHRRNPAANFGERHNVRK